jgi:hypothetical protein
MVRGLLKEPWRPAKGPVVAADQPAYNAGEHMARGQPVYEQQQVQKAQMEQGVAIIRHYIRSAYTAESVQDFSKAKSIIIQVLGLNLLLRYLSYPPVKARHAL